MRKGADECYDSRKAKCIQILIDDSTSEIVPLMDKSKDWLHRILTDALHRLSAHIGALLEHRDETELEIRCSMAQTLSEMQSRHVAALVAIEVKRETAHNRIDEREIAEYNAAVTKSRRLAADDQSDMACKVLNDARADLARQRGELHSGEDGKYDRLIGTEVVRQITELNGWRTNLNSQVELVHIACNVGLQGEYKKTTVFVRRSLRKAINDACREVRTKSVHPWATTELTQFTRHLLEL
jgi:hypothetical protein